MKRPVLAVLVVSVLMLYACAPSAGTATTLAPAPAASPTAVGAPTATPSPAPSACPSGYTPYTNAAFGFSACYPTGWTPWAREDPDQAIRWVEFIAPVVGEVTSREQLEFISVSNSPLPLGPSEAEFLHQMNKALATEHEANLRVPPRQIEMDGRRAVDSSHSASLALGRGVLEITAWTTILPANSRQWTIDIVGPSEYHEELDRLHDEFLSQFHVLAQ